MVAPVGWVKKVSLNTYFTYPIGYNSKVADSL